MNVKEIESKLADCLSAKDCSNVNFSDWEMDFLESIDEQFTKSQSLSKKQQDVLEKIWDKI